MVSPDDDRASNLDDILARLSALAPLESEVGADDHPAAPVPESAPTRREPVLDLTRIAEETERLAPAGVALEFDGDVVSPPLDYERDVVSPTIDYDAGPDITAPSEEPVIDLTESETAEGEVEQPVVAEAPITKTVEEPAVDPTDTAPPEAVVVEPQDITVPAPAAAASVHDLIDVRRPEPDQPSPTPTIRKIPGARTPNPFRRLIMWSVALGIVLLVVAGVVILN